jgi:hypothetical protein
LSLSLFTTKSLYTSLPFFIRATCPAYLILLNFSTRTKVGEGLTRYYITNNQPPLLLRLLLLLLLPPTSCLLPFSHFKIQSHSK